MPVALTLLVYALAVVRVTVFITKDDLIKEPREWLQRRIIGVGRVVGTWRIKTLDLIDCPWCVSIYVSAVAAPVWYYLGDNPWTLLPAVALAFSQLAGMLAPVGRGE
jgi:hypothetical protein